MTNDCSLCRHLVRLVSFGTIEVPNSPQCTASKLAIQFHRGVPHGYLRNFTSPHKQHRIPLSKLALKSFPFHISCLLVNLPRYAKERPRRSTATAVQANSWVVTHGYSGPPLRLVPPIMFLQAHDNSMSIQIESSVVILHHQGKNDSTNHDINAVSFP